MSSPPWRDVVATSYCLFDVKEAGAINSALACQVWARVFVTRCGARDEQILDTGLWPPAPLPARRVEPTPRRDAG